MKFTDMLIEAVKTKELTGFHGSDSKFTKFNTTEICIAKNINEAKRYGKNIYSVQFKDFLFETKTIYVLKKEQVLKIEPFTE